MSGLTEFQEEVARGFFSLDAALSDLFDRNELCDLAERIDSGFSRLGLAEALGSIDRFADSDFPSSAARPHQIREFASRWRDELN